MTKKSFTNKCGLVGLSIILFTACASNELKKSDNPEVVYNEAVRLLEDEDYLVATEFFNELRRRFPQSRYATLAELRQADLEYDQENYTSAAALYGVFVKLYPTHQDAAYALYRQADSFFLDAPDKIARDQSSAAQSLASAQRLVERYSQSQYTSQAREIITKSRLKLAQKEAYIAKFYEKRESWPSALERWTIILNDFSDLQNSQLEEARELYQQALSQSAALKGKIT